MGGSKKLGRPKGSCGKKGTLSNHEIDLIVKSIMNANRSNKYRNATLILFNHYLGLKAVDLAALKISDVFNGKDMLGGLVVSKVEPVRVLVFKQELQITLGSYIKNRMEKEGETFDLNLRLFKSQKGEFLPGTLARLINTIYKGSGFPNATSHTGKRSFVKSLITQTQDINVIGKMTGDVSMNVRRYLDEGK